ncbi:hypothetical protein I4U23_012988 [Adineta vaga]|nr:hypothetical protein I4U23_012988 [Adineta vaga]
MMYADMICDVMPPIPEDVGGHGIDHDDMETEIGDEAEANIEQLMVSMLEERDKLQEKLRDSEENLRNSQQKLTQIEKERDGLLHEFSSNSPQLLIDSSYLFKSINVNDRQLSLMSI